MFSNWGSLIVRIMMFSNWGSLIVRIMMFSKTITKDEATFLFIFSIIGK
jgi:hypothetical protein